ncbi:serine/threonine-protein kinase [Calothrix sp. PCC 7507]|uniref:serine/threonine protein kinase n=1 Tax=Calothrix sp. PCC 7507 TaxID=99598 RepID=UPI00029F0605|nr:serine/threonine-protein kinase [Calothrix sp. PCC 7507]AFY33252.1 serine/threonine protein kinase [Calothrix sp. PCC 7507]
MGLDVRNRYKEDIPLSNHPNFSRLGYQVIQELGRNRQAGRITYLAQALKSDQKVVIKEFHLASINSDLSGLKAYEREIAILQQLNHSRIPRYVDYFETTAGFYMVQEYKNAPSLGIKRCFHPEEIKQIAISVLEILVYLQRRISPIIHRDIKPENILVDERLNAYLVDFGLAQSQGAKMALSSFVAGTPGFMPPEEQLGHPLTEASDLYSLGATLICLLTRTRSVDVGKLVDEQHRFNFQKLLPQISPRFRLWLMKMVEHNRKHRYANAALALAALQPIQVLGTGTRIEILAAAVKRKKRAAMLGLATVGTLTAVGTTWMMAQPGGFAQQILEAQECLGSSLVSNCQDKTGH